MLLAVENPLNFMFLSQKLIFLCFPSKLLLTQRTQTSLKRLQHVLKRSRRLTIKPDVVKTSGKRRLIYVVSKTSNLWRLEGVGFMTSWRRLIYDVLRTSDLRRLQDAQFMMSSRCLIYDVLRMSDLRCLKEVRFESFWRRPIYDVSKTSVKRRLQDVCKTTSAWQSPSDVYETSKEIFFFYFVLSEIFRKF